MCVIAHTAGALVLRNFASGTEDVAPEPKRFIPASLLDLATGLAADIFRAHDDLLAENAVLRQQITVASSTESPQTSGTRY